MRNENPKMVEILNEETLELRCKKCGRKWFPGILSGGRLVRGSWQCPEGCKLKDLENDD
ncbi:hypothetical protein ES708_27518 [subsurface metagenome]